MDSGFTLEVGIIGNEGMVGTPVFLGSDRSPTRAISQIPGEALRMDARVFQKEMGRGGPLHGLVQRYTQAMINQISQSIVCNHRHSVEKRMCRWLLMSHDRVGADEFPLTHEFLAQMLGVCRPTVTAVAGTLQKAGLIQLPSGQNYRPRSEGAGSRLLRMLRSGRKGVGPLARLTPGAYRRPAGTPLRFIEEINILSGAS